MADVLESRLYQPYGGAVTGAPYGYSQTNYGFTGEPTDANGLLYLRARHYNPNLGVFASLDPFDGMADRPMSLNGYSWVEGNTPNMVDPSGMCAGSPCDLTDPNRDNDCWDRAFRIYRSYGVKIEDVWTMNQLAVLQRALGSIAFKLGDSNLGTGAGRFRRFISGGIKPHILMQDTLPQNPFEDVMNLVTGASGRTPAFTAFWQTNIYTIFIRRDTFNSEKDAESTIVHELGHYIHLASENAVSPDSPNRWAYTRLLDQFTNFIGATCYGGGIFCTSTENSYNPGPQSPVTQVDNDPGYGGSANYEDFATTWEAFITGRYMLTPGSKRQQFFERYVEAMRIEGITNPIFTNRDIADTYGCPFESLFQNSSNPHIALLNQLGLINNC